MEKIEKMNHKTTIQEQVSYIFITLKETINIFGTHLINATLLHFRRTFIQS
jgi:hypothetical protein